MPVCILCFAFSFMFRLMNSFLRWTLLSCSCQLCRLSLLPLQLARMLCLGFRNTWCPFLRSFFGEGVVLCSFSFPFFFSLDSWICAAHGSDFISNPRSQTRNPLGTVRKVQSRLRAFNNTWQIQRRKSLCFHHGMQRTWVCSQTVLHVLWECLAANGKGGA